MSKIIPFAPAHLSEHIFANFPFPFHFIARHNLETAENAFTQSDKKLIFYLWSFFACLNEAFVFFSSPRKKMMESLNKSSSFH